MLFKYIVINEKGEKKNGSIDATNRDLAINALQRRGLTIISIVGEEEKKHWSQLIIFERIPAKEIVILSRQIATLFESQVSALKVFSLLASNADNLLLAKKLTEVTDDLQAGSSISGALEKHPDVFSDFYINMVRAGEESGQLSQTFGYLADYLDRQYQLTSKTKNALIYPAFVILTFITVMILMFVVVIPKLSKLILESGQDVPFYTKIVIAISDFFVNYGFILIIFLLFAGAYGWFLSTTERGKIAIDNIKLSIPFVGNIYKKLYLARIADNLNTMLTAGVSLVRSIEISANVVGNRVYGEILRKAEKDVKEGNLLSDSLENNIIIPNILIQMLKVGEETGSLGSILKTLADFYKREVNEAVDNLVSLIEPIMIVFLGVGVGILLVSVLLPIYNIASSIV